MSVNKAILIGNLGADPEIRTLESGDKVANISIATSEKWKDKNTGERKEKTEWHRVSVWGNLAGICEQYLKKGSKVYIEGKIETRSWEQDGQKKYSTEIKVAGFGGVLQMLDSKIDTQPQAAASSETAPVSEDIEDEIPF